RVRLLRGEAASPEHRLWVVGAAVALHGREGAVRAEQGMVHAPGVDADAGRLDTSGGTFIDCQGDALDTGRVQGGHVPGGAALVLTDTSGKAMHFMHAEPAAVGHSEHHPPTGGAQVQRNVSPGVPGRWGSAPGLLVPCSGAPGVLGRRARHGLYPPWCKPSVRAAEAVAVTLTPGIERFQSKPK